jgi:selenoprotein W-related protein
MQATNKPIVTIIYCPKCNWMLRATYMAQEFLFSFADDVKGVMLQPAEVAGMYQIWVNDNLIFDRKTNGGFLEIKFLKQQIRDKVNPDKNLGHSDRI